MARRTATHTITTEGRDKGKTFVITEMPASQAESWAMRALLALMAAGTEVPEGFERMGMAAMAQIGFRALAGLSWEVAEPLLAEMWGCIQIQPDPTKPLLLRPLIEEDVEEIGTRIQLRAEVFTLHVDFSKVAALSKSKGSPASTGNLKTSRVTKTSPGR